LLDKEYIIFPSSATISTPKLDETSLVCKAKLMLQQVEDKDIDENCNEDTK